MIGVWGPCSWSPATYPFFSLPLFSFLTVQKKFNIDFLLFPPPFIHSHLSLSLSQVLLSLVPLFLQFVLPDLLRLEERSKTTHTGDRYDSHNPLIYLGLDHLQHFIGIFIIVQFTGQLEILTGLLPVT